MLKRIVGGACGGLIAWQFHVALIKYRTSSEVRVRVERSGGTYLFRPGSTSDLMMDSLDVGDVVLFDRSCYSMMPWNTVESLIQKYISKCRFDHVAVVLYDNKENVPVVAELDRRGRVVLTPYDRRVLMSQSNIIAVRRLRDRSRKNISKRDNDLVNSIRHDESYSSGGWIRRLRNAASEDKSDDAAVFVTSVLQQLEIVEPHTDIYSKIVHFSPVDDDDDVSAEKTPEQAYWDSYYDPPLYVQLF